MKKERMLKVGELPDGYYGVSPKPFIRIGGLWLKEAGFRIGDKAQIIVETGRLEVIRIANPETEKAQFKFDFESKYSSEALKI